MTRNHQRRSLFTFHRMMNDKSNYGKFSRRIRSNIEWDFIISRTHTFSKRTNWHLHLELSRSDLEISEIHTLKKSEDKSIERISSIQEKSRRAAWVLHKNVYKVPRLYSENRHRIKSRDQLFFSFYKYVEDSRIHCGHWTGASLHMMSNIDLTPEEQETIRKSKDPSVVMTVIWACLSKFNYWKNHPQYFWWINCYRKTTICMNDIRVSHHISSRMEEKSIVIATITWSQTRK